MQASLIRQRKRRTRAAFQSIRRIVDARAGFALPSVGKVLYRLSALSRVARGRRLLTNGTFKIDLNKRKNRVSMLEGATVISRADAQAQGLTRYFTGLKCGEGHLTWRNVSDKHCVTCKSLRSKAAEKKNPAGKRRRNSARRDRVRGATVSLTPDERRAIHELHALALFLEDMTGVLHDVDHIQPAALGGKTHPSNMRVIPGSMNWGRCARWDDYNDWVLNCPIDSDVTPNEQQRINAIYAAQVGKPPQRRSNNREGGRREQMAQNKERRRLKREFERAERASLIAQRGELAAKGVKIRGRKPVPYTVHDRYMMEKEKQCRAYR